MVWPLVMVLAGVGVVLALGYYFTQDKPVAADKPPATDATAPATPGATVPQPPAQEKPVDQPAQQRPTDPAPAPVGDAALRTERARINRAGAGDFMMMTVYYVDGANDNKSLQPVEMKVPRSLGRIRATVEHLINAPTNLKLFSEFPAGTQVIGAKLEDGVAIVDLSREAAAIRGSAAVSALRYALVYSLTEIDNVTAVELRINGHPAQLDQIVWDKAVGRNQLPSGNVYQIATLIRYQGP